MKPKRRDRSGMTDVSFPKLDKGGLRNRRQIAPKSGCEHW